jgi:plastocyanin
VRAAIPFAILAGCLGVGVLPAFAADTVVSAGASSWDPDEFAVRPGEQVTWTNASGVFHDLSVDGTQVQGAANAWTYGPHTYAARTQPYEYHCSIHFGMRGRFYVNDSGTVPTPTTTPQPSPSPSPLPTATPSPTSSPTPAGAGNRVTSFRARTTKRRFCTRRSATCPRPGVFLRLSLGASEPVRVRGTLRRGARRVRAVSLRVRPGSRRVRLPGPRLRPGRYALTLRAGAITRRVRFAVRPS